MRLLKKLFIIVGLIDVCMIIIIIVLLNQPICKFGYIDTNGNEGYAVICQENVMGDKHCRISATKVIAVEDY